MRRNPGTPLIAGAAALTVAEVEVGENQHAGPQLAKERGVPSHHPAKHPSPLAGEALVAEHRLDLVSALGRQRPEELSVLEFYLTTRSFHLGPFPRVKSSRAPV